MTNPLRRSASHAAIVAIACLALAGCIDPDEETQGITPPVDDPTTTTAPRDPAAPPPEPAPAAPATTPAAPDATDGHDAEETPDTADTTPAGVSVSPRLARRSPIAAARRYAELEGNYTPKTFQEHREQLRKLASGGLRDTLSYAARTDRIPSSSRTEILAIDTADAQPRGGQRTVYVIAQTTLGRSSAVNYRTIRVRLRDTARGWTVSSWTEISGS